MQLKYNFRSKGCIIPIVIALAKITPERTNTIIDPLLRNVIIFLIINCPQNPAKIDTDVRYKAETKKY